MSMVVCCFFVNDPATTEIYTYGHTLSLHDALPFSGGAIAASSATGATMAPAARSSARSPAASPATKSPAAATGPSAPSSAAPSAPSPAARPTRGMPAAAQACLDPHETHLPLPPLRHRPRRGHLHTPAPACPRRALRLSLPPSPRTRPYRTVRAQPPRNMLSPAPASPPCAAGIFAGPRGGLPSPRAPPSLGPRCTSATMRAREQTGQDSHAADGSAIRATAAARGGGDGRSHGRIYAPPRPFHATEELWRDRPRHQ